MAGKMNREMAPLDGHGLLAWLIILTLLNTLVIGLSTPPPPMEERYNYVLHRKPGIPAKNVQLKGYRRPPKFNEFIRDHHGNIL